jgi:hypothetical protein
MSRLFLHCGLCGRKQADGLLSRGYWGQLETGNGAPLRACPTCKGTHADLEERLRVALGGDSSASSPGYGGAAASTG